MREELGIDKHAVELGAQLAERRQDPVEKHFLARTSATSVDPAGATQPDDIREYRWWTLADLQATTEPGPTDVRMSCIVRLADTDAAWLRKDYAWQHTSRQPEVPVDLRPQVPPGARWRTRADFTRTVTGDSYTATFLADLERKVLVFDAVNPEKKG